MNIENIISKVPFLNRTLKSRKGSALMFSMFIMTILIFIAYEVSYDSVIEYKNSLNTVRRVQAYYAAESCHKLSLLRLKAFQQVARSPMVSSLPDKSMIDKIWSFPLMWPIQAPSTLSESDQDIYKNATKNSTFKHSFAANINSISGKIDINDLGSQSESLREYTKTQLLKYFQQAVQEESEFAKNYVSYDFNELLNHIGDWVDADDTSQNGGSERGYYTNFRSQFIPPNQAIKTLDELHMIKGMNDDIFMKLKSLITLYGGKGINVNYADEDALMAIHPNISRQLAQEIIKRRNDVNLGGPFKDSGEFYSFVGLAPSAAQDLIPLYFDLEINFEIDCIGRVGDVSRQIRSVVYDYQKTQKRLTEAIKKDNPKEENTGGTANACDDKTGEELFDCECKNAGNQPGSEVYTNCMETKRKAQTTQPNGSSAQPAAPLPPGPPFIIYYDVD